MTKQQRNNVQCKWRNVMWQIVVNNISYKEKKLLMKSAKTVMGSGTPGELRTPILFVSSSEGLPNGTDLKNCKKDKK